jgi:hypothetical protein
MCARMCASAVDLQERSDEQEVEIMTTTPQRIVELWPSLSEAARQALTEIAENATGQAPLELTDEEAAALARSREEFKSGRALSFEEMRAATDAFLAGLRAKA